MTVTYVEILGSEGAIRPSLLLTRQTRDALAQYAAIRWPTDRRKSVAREWDLTMDEARAVCEGTPGATTLDKVWKHPRGGWTVLLPVMGAVIGQPIHEFFRHQMQQAAKAAEHAQEHERLAQAAYRTLEGNAAATRQDRREGRSFGKVGSKAARGVAR